jgi:hypothetical protein
MMNVTLSFCNVSGFDLLCIRFFYYVSVFSFDLLCIKTVGR